VPRRGQENPPDWRRLYDCASTRGGYLSRVEAGEVGFSDQLLRHYVRTKRLLRPRRGIYRLALYPPGEHEDLIVIWLWTEEQGVFSHETALALHELSDALPARVHVTVPKKWEQRRLRVPSGVVLHFAEVGKKERAWVDVLPVTAPPRTVNDCAGDAVSPELLAQAIEQGLSRGLFDRDAVKSAVSYVRRGGIGGGRK
jgi:predicted transcriptional regulator of viral defense system